MYTFLKVYHKKRKICQKRAKTGTSFVKIFWSPNICFWQDFRQNNSFCKDFRENVCFRENFREYICFLECFSKISERQEQICTAWHLEKLADLTKIYYFRENRNVWTVFAKKNFIFSRFVQPDYNDVTCLKQAKLQNSQKCPQLKDQSGERWETTRTNKSRGLISPLSSCVTVPLLVKKVWSWILEDRKTGNVL